MRDLAFLALSAALAASLAAQQLPTPTDLPGDISSIRKTWKLSGGSDWDTLAVDPAIPRLYIARDSYVSVLDLTNGHEEGKIPVEAFAYDEDPTQQAIKNLEFLRPGVVKGRAHSIVFDPHGELGFISAGCNAEIPAKKCAAGGIVVFDRRAMSAIGTIAVSSAPHALVYEPVTGLLFAVRPAPPEWVQTRSGWVGCRNAPVHLDSDFFDQHVENCMKNIRNATSAICTRMTQDFIDSVQMKNKVCGLTSITVVDPVSKSALAILYIRGALGDAQADEYGNVFFAYSASRSPNEVSLLRLDAQTVADRIRYDKARAIQPDNLARKKGATSHYLLPTLNYTFPVDTAFSPPSDTPFFSFPVDKKCFGGRGLAVDGRHNRAFFACANGMLDVMNSITGESLALLPIGSGGVNIAFDGGRGLIYAPNNDAPPSLSIIRQTISDSYDVVQILPTGSNARAVTVDPATGLVYLVAAATDKSHAPIDGTLRVLVIGNSENSEIFEPLNIP